ncbi:MAG: glycosyltransferase [bacterium]|nr:glycosyltransferase [bacterium]
MTQQPLACLYHRALPNVFADAVHIMKMCQGFTQAGYAVTLFTPCAPDFDGNLNSLWHLYGIQQPFEIRFVQGSPVLRGHDVAVKTVAEVRRRGIRHVYARNIVAGLWTAQLGLETVVDLHAPPGERMGKLYLSGLFRGRGFRRLNVTTHVLKGIYLHLYPGSLSPQQVSVDPNGIDLDDFAALPQPTAGRAALGLPERFTVGYSGHLYPGRGIELILELARRLPAFQFLLVGGTPEDAAHWRQEAARLELHNVTLTGFVPNAELTRWYAASDVLLMPYQREVTVHGGKGNSAAFMSPMKMFEYMATRRVIVSSDLTVLREVLNDNNACLVPPDDVDRWQAAIEQAHQNPIHAETLSSRAYADVQKHTWQQRARRLMDGL